jgi:hypothetical protein
MTEPKFNHFKLPEKILNELYELTGSKDAYKGFIIAYCDEKGRPIVYTNCESQITEAGLIRSIESYISENTDLDFEVEPD